MSGLDHPWDIGFLPNGTMLVTERPGRLDRIVGGQAQLVTAPADVVAASEAGMLGLAVDPTFATTGYVFVCMASSSGRGDRRAGRAVHADAERRLGARAAATS